MIEPASNNEYETFLRTKRLPLSFWDLCTLWMAPVAFFILPFWRMYKRDSQIDYIDIFLWIVVAYYIYTNIRATKFKFFANTLPVAIKEQAILQMQNQRGLLLANHSRHYFQFKEPATWKKWSSYITIIFDEEGYYVNCIDSWFRTITIFSGLSCQTNDIIVDLTSLSHKAQTTAANTANNVVS